MIFVSLKKDGHLFCCISEQIHLFFFLSFCQMLSNSHDIFMSFYDLTDFCVWMWTLTRRPVLYCLRTVCTTSRPSSFATLDQILKQLETMLASTSLLRCVPRPPLATPAPSWCTGLGWWLMVEPWPTHWTRVWRISSWPWLEVAGPFYAVARRPCRRVWWSS